ncbi:RPA-interacting protein [Dioscorea alata]|uniref:RPA-interacting protein n=1 Tax=Dioscorea alata TaxID=55571 RepID=A0ACB7UT05_DIOAL|nr:RPA-interacting protein [Dioscorea alata]
MDDNRHRRPSLKSIHPDWKEKLRNNCLRRVRNERANLLWKIRTVGKQTPDEKEIMESTFRGIVSDELKKIKLLPLNGQMGISPTEISDVWEYDGPHEGTQENDSEELLIEMQRLLYEDLREELIQRELNAYEEEDEYLAQAVFEHMQLNNDLIGKDKTFWCPVCKQGVLRESHRLIYCSSCKLRLDLENDKVNLDFLRNRLGEVHMDHLDKGCKATPNFYMDSSFNLTALYIQCIACDTFEIVM